MHEDDIEEVDIVETESEEVEVEEVTEAGEQDEPTEHEQSETEAEAEESEPDEEEVVISIDNKEIEQSQPAPTWVKELRKTNKEVSKRNKELEAQLEALKNPQRAATTLRDKPTIDSHDYDSEAYENDLFAWIEEKRAVDDSKAKVKQAEETQQAEWNMRLEDYGKARGKLNARDFDEAEEFVVDSLSTTQQGVIIGGATDPALVVYALGKNKEKAKELADIKDPVKFAFAIARLEGTLTVKNRKKAPPPERKIANGTGKVATNSALERLRDEAMKTGDMTKVLAYKRLHNL